MECCQRHVHFVPVLVEGKSSEGEKQEPVESLSVKVVVSVVDKHTVQKIGINYTNRRDGKNTFVPFTCAM